MQYYQSDNVNKEFITTYSEIPFYKLKDPNERYCGWDIMVVFRVKIIMYIRVG